MAAYATAPCVTRPSAVMIFTDLVFQGPLLLTWINFNPSMDKWSHAQYSVGGNYISIPKFQPVTVAPLKFRNG